ncbi:EAL domain-containing protein, partial [Shewanella sairae]|uniref:EAL domain-containing protein n=1 Tax=Shewanella sairae TaxID=190310 RepID=UPI001C7EF555
MNVLIVDKCKFARSITRAKFSEVFKGLDVVFENAENSKSAISSLDNTQTIGCSRINLLIIDLSIMLDDKFTLINYMVGVKDYFKPVIIIGLADNCLFEFVSNNALELNLNLADIIKTPLKHDDIYNIVTNKKCKLSSNKPSDNIGFIFGATCIKEDFNKKNLCLYYQPKVDIKTKKVVGFEVLSRIKTNNNTIYPDEFIPLLEKEKQSY